MRVFSFTRWEQALRSIAVLDYLLTLLTNGLGLAIGIITGVLTARLLGPVGKGELAVVYWLPGLMAQAGILALPQAVAFGVSCRSTHDETLTAAGFWVSLGLGLIEAAILYPLVPYAVGPDRQHLVPISRFFLPYLPLTFSGLTLVGVDQGRQAFARYNVLRILPSIVYVACLLVLWRLGRASVSTIAMSNLLAAGIAWGVRAGAAGAQLLPHHLSPFLESAQQLLRRGVLFHLPSLTGLILMRADIPLLTRTVSAEEVGYYSVALAIAMAQSGVATSLVQVGFPKVVVSESRKTVEVLLRQFRLAQPMIFGVAGLMALCSPWIVRFLFGEAFLPASSVAPILVGAMAVWGLNQVLDNGLRGMGYGKPGTLANALGLSVLVASGLLLVRWCGITGMAISVFASQIGVLTILLLYFRREDGFLWGKLWGLNRPSLRELVGSLQGIWSHERS